MDKNREIVIYKKVMCVFNESGPNPLNRLQDIFFSSFLVGEVGVGGAINTEADGSSM